MVFCLYFNTFANPKKNNIVFHYKIKINSWEERLNTVKRQK